MAEQTNMYVEEALLGEKTPLKEFMVKYMVDKLAYIVPIMQEVTEEVKL